MRHWQLMMGELMDDEMDEIDEIDGIDEIDYFLHLTIDLK